MDKHTKKQWFEIILIGIVVAFLGYVAYSWGVETDDDYLLLEPPSFGTNQWLFVKSDRFSNKFSYEKSTLKIENHKIVVWIRQDSYVPVPIKGKGEIITQQWELDCENKKGIILQKWTIDGTNYPWKSHPVDKQPQTLNPHSVMLFICFHYADKI